jgi:hypothetical protein
METYSQSHQDIFALLINNKKRNGYFVEIGSNHPIVHNNTYLLETKYNWKGLMIEYDTHFEPLYKQYRPNSIYEIGDARTVKYFDILESNHFPKNIDYLQLDLDVNNRSTLDTFLLLNDIVFDTYKFAAITLEHDIYTGNYFNTQTITRKILEDRGYVLVFPNVCVNWNGGIQPFEDWYVHPELVDMSMINGIKTKNSLLSNDIIDRFIQYKQ